MELRPAQTLSAPRATASWDLPVPGGLSMCKPDEGSQAAWPTANVVVGIPLFLGGKPMRAVLVDDTAASMQEMTATIAGASQAADDIGAATGQLLGWATGLFIKPSS